MQRRQILRGTVKKFFSQPGKRYGFMAAMIKDETTDVFFHCDKCCTVQLGSFEPQFGTRRFKGQYHDPKPGDQLVFALAVGRKGLLALSWAYAHEWEAAEAAIYERNHTFRFYEIPHLSGQTPDQPIMVWEGTELAELERWCPLDLTRKAMRVPGTGAWAYLLAELPTHRVWGCFQQQTVAGWQFCSDPRVVMGATRGA